MANISVELVNYRKVTKAVTSSFRFDVKLEPSVNGYAELFYPKLVADAVKKQHADGQFVDDVSSDESLLKHFSDLGKGYDEDDSFVDNSEPCDEQLPPNLTAQFGGFYVNSGKLTFKDVSANVIENKLNGSVKRKLPSWGDKENVKCKKIITKKPSASSIKILKPVRLHLQRTPKISKIKSAAQRKTNSAINKPSLGTKCVTSKAINKCSVNGRFQSPSVASAQNGVRESNAQNFVKSTVNSNPMPNVCGEKGYMNNVLSSLPAGITVHVSSPINMNKVDILRKCQLSPITLPADTTISSVNSKCKTSVMNKTGVCVSPKSSLNTSPFVSKPKLPNSFTFDASKVMQNNKVNISRMSENSISIRQLPVSNNTTVVNKSLCIVPNDVNADKAKISKSSNCRPKDIKQFKTPIAISDNVGKVVRKNVASQDKKTFYNQCGNPENSENMVGLLNAQNKLVLVRQNKSSENRNKLSKFQPPNVNSQVNQVLDDKIVACKQMPRLDKMVEVPQHIPLKEIIRDHIQFADELEVPKNLPRDLEKLLSHIIMSPSVGKPKMHIEEFNKQLMNLDAMIQKLNIQQSHHIYKYLSQKLQISVRTLKNRINRCKSGDMYTLDSLLKEFRREFEVAVSNYLNKAELITYESDNASKSVNDNSVDSEDIQVVAELRSKNFQWTNKLREIFHKLIREKHELHCVRKLNFPVKEYLTVFVKETILTLLPPKQVSTMEKYIMLELNNFFESDFFKGFHY